MIHEQAWDFHLVEVCAGFWGYPFEDLHILNEELASSFDLCKTCTIPPGHEGSRKGQAISPSMVGVHTGNLSASDEVAGIKLSGSKFACSRDYGERPTCNLEQFRSQIFRFIGMNDILGEQPGLHLA